jgi:hypothetical protein
MNSNEVRTGEDVSYDNQLLGHLAVVSIYLSALLFLLGLKDSQVYGF